MVEVRRNNMISYCLDAGLPGLHDHVAGSEQQLLEPLPLLAAKQQLSAHQQRTLLFQGTVPLTF